MILKVLTTIEDLKKNVAEAEGKGYDEYLGSSLRACENCGIVTAFFGKDATENEKELVKIVLKS